MRICALTLSVLSLSLGATATGQNRVTVELELLDPIVLNAGIANLQTSGGASAGMVATSEVASAHAVLPAVGEAHAVRSVVLDEQPYGVSVSVVDDLQTIELVRSTSPSALVRSSRGRLRITYAGMHLRMALHWSAPGSFATRAVSVDVFDDGVFELVATAPGSAAALIPLPFSMAPQTIDTVFTNDSVLSVPGTATSRLWISVVPDDGVTTRPVPNAGVCSPNPPRFVRPTFGRGLQLHAPSVDPGVMIFGVALAPVVLPVPSLGGCELMPRIDARIVLAANVNRAVRIDNLPPSLSLYVQRVGLRTTFGDLSLSDAVEIIVP